MCSVSPQLAETISFRRAIPILFIPAVLISTSTNSVAELHIVIQTFARKLSRSYPVASEDALESQNNAILLLCMNTTRSTGTQMIPCKVIKKKRNSEMNNFTNRNQY